MKIETETYVKVLLLLLVICAVLATYKYWKTAGTMRASANVFLVPPAPTAPAPHTPMGFNARPFKRVES